MLFNLTFNAKSGFNTLILSAQEKKIQYKVEVKEKLLYVLALDKDRNPVTDLEKDDFQLFVDGQPQEIKTFSFISHTSKNIIEEKRKILPEKFEFPDISLKEEETGKRFTLAVLPYTYHSSRQKWSIKKAITHLAEQARYPDNWIGIVVLHRDWISTIHDFTCSKEQLLKKFDAYFNLDTKKLKQLHNQYPLTAEEISQVPQLPIFQSTIRTFHHPFRTIGGKDIIPGLEIIAEKMKILKGRKTILCFALPLDIFSDSEDSLISSASMNRLDAFYTMINKMISGNITIYYSEIKDLKVQNFFDASSPIKLDSYLLPGSSPTARHVKSYMEFCEESSHFALANETGGKYYYNISSPTYFIDDVNKMNNSYYLLSFPITEKLGKKKYHNIRLECRRQGIKLYYSNKYYAPHELEEKKFVESYKRIQLYKYIFIDTTREPDFDIYGQWITLPGDETNLQTGALDFYLPEELLQRLPISFQLGCSYSDAKERGIIFQWELTVSSSDKDKIKAAHGYVVRILAKLPEGEKSFRFVAMDSESGKFGRFDIDMSRESGKLDLSNIILGRLVEKKHVFQFRDYSEAMYNVKKKLYNLLLVNDQVIIPSVNNAFNAGENITFFLIHKVPEGQAKRYKNVKAVAYFSMDKEGQITEITLPVSSKKVAKHYRQYYGTIDTINLKKGKYRIEIDLKDANNSIIAATDAYFKIAE
jgi:VWFA-related protein